MSKYTDNLPLNDRGAIVTAKNMTRLEKIQQQCPEKVIVDTWSPGDGFTRYRFVKDTGLGDNSYFGASHNDILATCYGAKEAEMVVIALKRYAEIRRS